MKEAREPGTGLGNLEEAARWYRKAAEAGHAQAAFFLGRLYSEKLGDWQRAEPWYRKPPPDWLLPRAAPAKTGCVVLAVLPLLLTVLAIVTKTA
ncbi:hypothetical protein M8542_47395 [Amycolatopsis sp. OK19-0408]|uniref:Sel1 repeat family protein n=1 Tax=Amycolatopsis iheyensis TaxID=2945988 RepID=A0A9X2NKG0_9PSEU|nr:hypothetical protein [Amycolatopsis iheyensis]MCR6490456.1 hypothetical protein [Amycolatopsis iheyensis]